MKLFTFYTDNLMHIMMPIKLKNGYTYEIYKEDGFQKWDLRDQQLTPTYMSYQRELEKDGYMFEVLSRKIFSAIFDDVNVRDMR